MLGREGVSPLERARAETVAVTVIEERFFHVMVFPLKLPRSRLWRALGIAYREMFDFAGFETRSANAVLAPLFVLPTVFFVLRLMEFDRRLKRDGVPPAMGWVLSRYYGGMSLIAGMVPPSGPVLLAGNHPGLGDLPALSVAAGRYDLVAVAKRRELTEEMSGVLGRCIVIDDSLRSRAEAVRSIVRTLRAGGAVVVYPAGEIERDPSVFTTASEFLGKWPPVLDAIHRRLEREGLRVPVVPVYTEGVHHVPPVLRRLVHAGRTQKSREGRAALSTMITRRARRYPVRIAVGEAVYLEASQQAAQPRSITTMIRAALMELEHLTRPFRPGSSIPRVDGSHPPLDAPVAEQVEKERGDAEPAHLSEGPVMLKRLL